MNLVKCENGHFYDEERYPSCPHCAAPALRDDNLTVPVMRTPANDAVTVALDQSDAAAPAPAPASPAGTGWICPACKHADNAGKFCSECGQPMPQDEGWHCECGAANKGKFCSQCGKPKPEGAPLYKCDKCGWEPEDPAHPPKFCPECGDPFDANDVKK